MDRVASGREIAAPCSFATSRASSATSSGSTGTRAVSGRWSGIAPPPRRAISSPTRAPSSRRATNPSTTPRGGRATGRRRRRRPSAARAAPPRAASATARCGAPCSPGSTRSSATSSACRCGPGSAASSSSDSSPADPRGRRTPAGSRPRPAGTPARDTAIARPPRATSADLPTPSSPSSSSVAGPSADRGEEAVDPFQLGFASRRSCASSILFPGTAAAIVGGYPPTREVGSIGRAAAGLGSLRPCPSRSLTRSLALLALATAVSGMARAAHGQRGQQHDERVDRRAVARRLDDQEDDARGTSAPAPPTTTAAPPAPAASSPRTAPAARRSRSRSRPAIAHPRVAEIVAAVWIDQSMPGQIEHPARRPIGDRQHVARVRLDELDRRLRSCFSSTGSGVLRIRL